MAGVSVFCKEERRDDWKKADTEDIVSPCTPSEDLEDLERNRRNDSDVGAAERLSSLERKKRAVLKFIGSCRYLAYGGLSSSWRLVRLLEERLEEARSCAAKAGNSFRTFGHHRRDICCLAYWRSLEHQL